MTRKTAKEVKARLVRRLDSLKHADNAISYTVKVYQKETAVGRGPYIGWCVRASYRYSYARRVLVPLIDTEHVATAKALLAGIDAVHRSQHLHLAAREEFDALHPLPE